MKIILANPRGFCAGVNMAIECLERALELFGSPVYVYHEIVHNKYVVERFKGRGTVFVESLDEVPDGATLLYSAHGVSPQIREQARGRRLRAIDATCPLVTKVHLEAIKYAREGYTIVLIGHEGHDEVIGTMGEAPDQMVLVETAEDVERLDSADPTQGGLSDADDAQRRRRQPHHRGAPRSSSRRSPARRRTTSATPRRTARRPSASWRAGRRGPGAGQPEQLEQPAAGGDRPVDGHAGAPDRRRLGDPAGLVRGRRDGPDHGRGQRRRTWSRSASTTSWQSRRDDRRGLCPRRERPLPAAQVASRAAPRGRRAARSHVDA